MATRQDKIQVWSTASGMVVGSLLNDLALVSVVAAELPDAALVHEDYRNAYAALLQLSLDGDGLITPELVAEQSGTDIGLLTAAQMAAEEGEQGRVLTNAKVVVRLGKKFSIELTFQQVADGKLSPDEAIARYQTLAAYGLTDRDTTTAAMLEELFNDEQMASLQNPSGVPPLDMMTWEFPIGEITTVAGEYGKGKSRFAQAVALGEAARGNTVAYIMAEGDRRWFTARAIAMIVAYLMRERGMKVATDEQFPSAGILIHKRKLWQSNPKWSGLIDEAKLIYGRLPLHVFDPVDGATEPHEAALHIKKAIHSLNARMVILDYIGDMNFKGVTDKERMAVAKPYIKQLSVIGRKVGKGAHIIVLSQRSEEQIKSDSDRHGIMGGGDLAAVSNNIFVLKSTEAPDGHYEVKLTAAKVRDNAATTQFTLHAHRESGLLYEYQIGTNGFGSRIDLLNVVLPEQGEMELD